MHVLGTTLSKSIMNYLRISQLAAKKKNNCIKNNYNKKMKFSWTPEGAERNL